MVKLLRWVSVLMFLAIPVLLIAAIWVGEIRYLWISIVNVFFSVIAAGFSESLKKVNDGDGTLF